MTKAKQNCTGCESVEVVLVTYNSARHIGACLDSIIGVGATAIVVDNGSTDSTEQIVAQYERTKYITAGSNLGYGAAVNLGFRETSGEYVILSNPDVIYPPETINSCIEFLKSQPTVGAVGIQQVFPDGSWQRSYGNLPSIASGLKDAVGYCSFQNAIRRSLWPKKVDRSPRQVPYVDGGILAVRREAFQQVGGFDEAFFFYSEEADLCHRLRNSGWKVMFVPAIQVIHARGGSTGAEQSDKFLRCLVTSRMLLAERCLPAWQAKVYAWLESMYFAELALIYKLLRAIRRNRRDQTISDKIWMFNSYVAIWREYLKQGSISGSYRPSTWPRIE